MKVISLFDGMSGGQLALKKADLNVSQYHACEIDKYAIKVTQENFPSTIQHGDVTKFNPVAIPLRNRYINKPDLLIAGSPCQGFSFATNGRLNFDDHRSKLFFEFVRIFNLCKPKYFLLENVPMAKACENVITNMLGVEPITINSGLISAQNRKRLYWTNIPNVIQPEDKNIVLDDILLPNTKASGFKIGNLKTYDPVKNEAKVRTLVRHLQTASPTGLCQVGEADLNGHDSLKRVYHPLGKSPTVNTMGGGNREPKVYLGNMKYRRLEPIEIERLQGVPDNYTNHVSKTQRCKMLGNGFQVDTVAHILSFISK